MTPEISHEPIEILLVEDSRGDVRLIREALRTANFPHHLNVVEDGEAAMSYLKGSADNVEGFRPDIMILDLNLPRRSGLSVLEEVKETPSLRRLPVIVLTTSQSEDDIAACYDRHANCYITKPFDMDSFVEIVGRIRDHWFSTVRLPPH